LVAMIILVMIVQVLSLALMPSLSSTVESPIPTTPPSDYVPLVLSYILLVLGFTLFILVALRLKKDWFVGVVILVAVALSAYYVFSALVSPIIAMFLSFFIFLILHYYPEWYVVDLVGLLICAGVSTLFGLVMTVPSAMLLLILLAIYDAISVYKTRHMVSLAEGMMDIKAPLLFIVPRRRDYSFIKEGMGEVGRRGAYFLGLGDTIIPTVLVISANWALSEPSYSLVQYNLAGLGINVPALGAMLGTYLGFVALSMTSRDKPQAGLPFLNGGAIVGFLVGSFVSGIIPI